MNFMFEWQEQYLTSERSERVRYCSCHSNIKFISSSHRVISSMYFLEWSISLATPPLVSLRNDGTIDEFHTDDASRRRSGYCFVSNFLQPIRSTTQIWVAVSDTSSIWNFWARSSDVILKGNQRSGIAKCFSGEPKIISELQLIVGRVILLLSSNSA